MKRKENRKEKKTRNHFSALKSVYGFRVRLQNPKAGIYNLNPDFLIERTLREEIIKKKKSKFAISPFF